MPTYSYACTECGHAFDIRQSFTDDPLTDCPECGASQLRKVIHPVGIAFKGSGFYKTDSRAAGKGSAPKPTGSEASSTADSSSGSSDKSGGDSTSAPAAKESSGTSSASTSAPAAS